MHYLAENDILGLSTPLFKHSHLLGVRVELVVAPVELLPLEGGER